MDVLLSQTWRLADLILLLCHSLGFLLHKRQHLPKHTKMLRSQAFFKTPRGGRRVHLFIKLSTVFLSEKVNNCSASLGSGKEFIK